jgi:predicted NAD/FAD-dependent oxidoreductase
MNSDWSLNHFDRPDDENLYLIQTLFKSYLKNEYGIEDIGVLKSQIKKWRYSHPVNPMNNGYYKLNEQIVLLGDGFSGASINAAVKSGFSVPLGMND